MPKLGELLHPSLLSSCVTIEKCPKRSYKQGEACVPGCLGTDKFKYPVYIVLESIVNNFTTI